MELFLQDIVKSVLMAAFGFDKKMLVYRISVRPEMMRFNRISEFRGFECDAKAIHFIQDCLFIRQLEPCDYDVYVHTNTRTQTHHTYLRVYTYTL